MTASELKDKLDMYISHGHGDDEIVIHLKEPSVGAAVAEAIKGIYPGIDWDSGRLMIEPAKPLLHHGNSRDDPKAVVRITYRNNYGGKIKPVLHCPWCETKLNKDMKFCPHCGQKIDMKNIREVTL